MELSSDLSHKVLGLRVERFLREKHARDTAKRVAADTGCNLSAVEKWLEGTSAPGGVALLRLIAAYGPEFIMAAWPHEAPEWLSNAALDERIRRAEAARAALETELRHLHAAR